MSAAAMEEHHGQALAAVLDDPNVDGVVLLSVPPTFLKPTALAEEVLKVCRTRPNKPVSVCLIGGEFVREACQLLEKEGVPTYEVPDRAARAMSRMVERTLYLQTEKSSTQSTQVQSNRDYSHKVIAQALAAGRNLLEHEANELLSTYGISSARSALVQSEDEGVVAASKIGYPIVLKIVSPDILHKSDAQAVKVNIKNEEELRSAYREIISNSLRYNKDARIEGILVCAMAKPGVEAIIGAKRDSQFGPVVMFGLGGIFVEVFKDVTFRVAPVSLAGAREMVSSIKGYPLLNGARGREVCDTESLAQMIVNVGKLMLECPEVSEIDLNPVAVYEQGQGALALDARIILAAKNLGNAAK
ncbi:acetate--CoA ligase family protein [Paradesulfitobacterium ferrireducens]|uniref:acetate--CoA ligase family protein n=1 Tax=Paradesulfitobacterium ferrireducens TaxID=2816476 RepID=UPI001A8EEA65|nr:acetate--CoA ligase family protein [Paradesulfitobacterium ferrireducens]